jgi:hypothetical protein
MHNLPIACTKIALERCLILVDSISKERAVPNHIADTTIVKTTKKRQKVQPGWQLGRCFYL